MLAKLKKTKPRSRSYRDIEKAIRRDALKRNMGCAFFLVCIMALFGAVIYYMPEDSVRAQSNQQRDARRGK